MGFAEQISPTGGRGGRNIGGREWDWLRLGGREREWVRAVKGLKGVAANEKG
jgi:hypothetical protein